MRDNKLQRRILICTIARTEDFWWLLMVGGLLWGCSPFVWAFFFGFFGFFFGKVHQQFDFGFWSAVAVMAFWSAVDISTLGLRLLLWLLACGCCTGFWYAVAVLALVCGCCFDSWSAVAVPVIL